jgi:hypothetical protein
VPSFSRRVVKWETPREEGGGGVLCASESDSQGERREITSNCDRITQKKKAKKQRIEIVPADNSLATNALEYIHSSINSVQPTPMPHSFHQMHYLSKLSLCDMMNNVYYVLLALQYPSPINQTIRADPHARTYALHGIAISETKRREGN